MNTVARLIEFHRNLASLSIRSHKVITGDICLEQMDMEIFRRRRLFTQVFINGDPKRRKTHVFTGIREILNQKILLINRVREDHVSYLFENFLRFGEVINYIEGVCLSQHEETSMKVCLSTINELHNLFVSLFHITIS
jgi:hypothetical protein